jgi:hypothetical protein
MLQDVKRASHIIRAVNLQENPEKWRAEVTEVTYYMKILSAT